MRDGPRYPSSTVGGAEDTSGSPPLGFRHRHRRTRIGSLSGTRAVPGVQHRVVDVLADRVPPAVRARFDFVAFDPRGIGESTPRLKSAMARGRFVGRGGRSVLAARAGAPAPELAKANGSCFRRTRESPERWAPTRCAGSGPAAQGGRGPQLTFWATSYGTRIGYVYAYKYRSGSGRWCSMETSTRPATIRD